MCVQWCVLLFVKEKNYDGIQVQKLVFINFIIIGIPDLVNVFSFKYFSQNKTFKDALYRCDFYENEKKEHLWNLKQEYMLC